LAHVDAGKTTRGPGGEKLAYVRMFSGTIRTRDRLRFSAARASAGGRRPAEQAQSRGGR
jgi:ribosomal protection tetracycline resistance protein